MRLFIFEKPNVSKAVKPFLTANDIACSAQGHLVEPAMPEDYNPALKAWDLNLLPFFPEDFIYKAKTNTAHVLNNIKTLIQSNNIDEIVNACDYEREGELIFYLIINYIKIKPSTKITRLKMVDLSNEGITKALKTIEPAANSIHFYHQALIRQKADFLLGINLTRAYTKTMAKDFITPIGRIKSPILKIVTDRFLANKDFKPTDYFKIRLNLHANNVDFNALSALSFKTKAEAETLTKSLDSKILLNKAEFKNISEKPDELLNLSGLQKKVYRKFKYSPAQTLEIAQKLYDEHKLITYPRTEGKALATVMVNEIKKTLETFKKYDKVSHFIHKLSVNEDNSILFNDKKVTDHHAIIPTNAIPSQPLSLSELNVYHIILESFFQAMGEPLKYTKTHYNFLCQNSKLEFSCTGKKITQKGYTEILLTGPADVEEEKEDQHLPILNEKELINKKAAEVLSKKTTPPALYNYASLLAVLENPKSIDLDETNIEFQLSEDIEGFSLGTQATRANIIQDMISRPKSELLSIVKNNIVPTDLGLFLYENSKNQFFSNPYMTAGIEKQIKTIDDANAKSVSHEIIAKMQNLIATEIVDLKAKNITTTFSKSNDIGATCPSCKAPIIETKNSYVCKTLLDWLKSLTEEQKAIINTLPKPCSVSIPKEYFGKPISLTEAKNLFKLKDSAPKEFLSKEKQTKYQASLFLDPNKNFIIQKKFQNTPNTFKKVTTKN